MGVLNNLARLHSVQGDPDGAEPLYRRALDIMERSLGESHPRVAGILVNLADVHAARGELAQAEPLLQRSLRILEASLGPEHPRVGVVLDALARARLKQGRYAEAGRLFARSTEITQRTLGEGHPALERRDQEVRALFADAGAPVPEVARGPGEGCWGRSPAAPGDDELIFEEGMTHCGVPILAALPGSPARVPGTPA